MSDFMFFGGTGGLLHKDFHKGKRLEFKSNHLEFFGKKSLLSVGH
jgi:hypothetical protein